MAMVDSRGPGGYQFPQRKPVGAPPLSANINRQQHRSHSFPDIDFTASGRQPTQPHSSAFPMIPRQSTQPTSPSVSPPYYNPQMSTTRRTPSNATSSTSNSTAVPTRTPSTVSSNLSRTASSRSGASLSPSSYVALIRKQKATVWCDRAQREDPRILAQQKAAKMRAAREVCGATTEGRTSTGSIGSNSGVRIKMIRHHGAPKATGYHYPNMVAGGVPMRLSATEVGDEASVLDGEEGLYHQRTDSGMSYSNRWMAPNHRQSSRYSQGSLRLGGQGTSPSEDIPELEETPVPRGYKHSSKDEEEDYFSPSVEGGHEGGSGSSSSELESSFGSVGQMRGPQSARDIGRSRTDDLRRRGSVDERSNTMGGLGEGRLYVTNPDLSD